MPLVTANQFRLQPDPNAFAGGIQQGMKLRGQFDQRQDKQQAQQVAQGEAERSKKLEAIRFLDNAAAAIQNTPEGERAGVVNSLSGRLQEFGIDPKALGQDFSNAALANFRSSLSPFLTKVAKTTAERDFASSTEGLTPEQVKQARLVDLGLVPRASSSAQERLGDDPEKSARVAASQAKIEAAKETAKLSSQLKLKPEVEAAVVSAVGDAKLQIKAAGEERSNKVAFNVYETAISNLVTSLGGTTTGPGAGFIPAITANAQIADGAVAMMAPVLKQLFRGAGEGTFTDQDQKMLLALIPDRNTLPAARKSQLAAIDALVRAKLRITEAPATAPATVAAPVQEQEFDSGLLEFMTPEERALFDGA